MDIKTKTKTNTIMKVRYSQTILRVLMVLLALPMAWVSAWAGSSSSAKSNMAIVSADTGQGLVYMKVKQNSTPSNPNLSAYVGRSPEGTGYTEVGSSTSAIKTTYFWAKPARGYKFKAYSGYQTAPASSTVGSGTVNAADVRATWDGVCDKIETTNGGGQSTDVLITASFEPVTSYNITYAVPVGGSYNISYNYLTINSSKKFEEKTDNYSMTATSEAKVEKSYADDVVTLTASGANFAGWYEGTTSKGTGSGTNHSYTYPITKTATITALFKVATLGDVTGDLGPVVNAGKVSELTSFNGTITIPVSAYGSWVAGDFMVTFTEQTSRGDITKGTVTYAKSTGNDLGSTGTLTIPFTYNPASFGGTEVEVTVTPAYGDAKTFSILASANRVLNYEACVLLGEETEPQDENTGTLAEMVTLANTLDSKPKVQLAKNCTIASPLSLTKSMTFDLNDKTLASTGASAFSIAAQGIDVQIVDDGFSKLGTIATTSSQSGNVSVVTFAQKAKLTMRGGTLSATNTGSGSVYGINVTQGSIFYMSDGRLTVTGVSEARGVNVATASDYATFNGGSIAVSAPTNAYGLWSAGQSNITNANVVVETTTGANAYGVYTNGGVSTITATDFAVNARTTNAYGAYVNAGRLNFNGGKLIVEAVTSGVYGAHIAAGATATLQQNAIVKADATGASGTNVYGVNNLGTVTLNNITVTATSPTNNATAVNTMTSAVSTTIEDGTYTANVETGTAYGLHHQYGTLDVDGGTFRGIVKTSGTYAYGIRAAANATIANATMLGETRESGNTAYGFVGGVANKTITLTNCDITGKSNTSKAYAIFSRTGVTATGCTLTATTLGTTEAYGLYAENGTNRLTNCNATVSANTVKAYGINHLAGLLTIEGGAYNVEAKQASTATAQNSELYGIYSAANQTVNVTDATIAVSAFNAAYSQNVYGAYINGTLNSTGSTYSAQAKLNVYGIWGNTASTLNLANNTISSRATNGTVSYGVYAKKNFAIDGDVISAVGSATNVYAMYLDASTSTGNVLGGKFSAVGNGTNGYGAINENGSVGKVYLKGGVYKTTVNLNKYIHPDCQIFHLDETHADYADGYRYIIAEENPSPYVCRIVGGAYYTTLEAAMQYTLDNGGSNHTIVMTQSYTLPAGDYTLPSNATLVVPYKSDQTSITSSSSPANPDITISVGLREEFLRLTLATGVNLNVNGKIGVGGQIYAAESGRVSYNNSPFGHIRMEEGSLIQLNSGAYLYAWGFITGAGNITVKNNAEVREIFQVGDMKAASPLGYHYYDNNQKFFPITQYCIQNIEVPTTYYFNSRLIAALQCYYPGLGGMYYGDKNIKLVGTDGALFGVTSDDESSWVRKSYNANTDYQVWEVNSAAKLGSISLTLDLPFVGQQTFSTLDYILPVTSNMKIHVLDGDFTISQSTEFMPGSSVEVDKTASLTINETYKNRSNKTQNLCVYVFDKDQWPSSLTLASCSPAYSLGWPNGTKPSRTAGDAAINVHGNINLKGKLYTTRSIADGTNATYGANIYSTNADAGTVSFENNAASSTTSISLITGISNNAIVSKAVTMDPALLKNGTGASQAFTPTSGITASHACAYINNEWQETYTNGCFEVIGSTVYAKPAEYVALKKTQTTAYGLEGVEETNHTYLTIDDNLLILMMGCQWWEVEATTDPAVFECKKPGYEGFYYYDTTEDQWKLKTVNVKFYSAETGDNILKTIVTDFNGIPDQAVIASNPTKATTAAATYQFYGWKSSVTGTIYKWTDQLEVATADMSYRPVFTETPRHYTVTFVNANNGANVPVETAYGDHPTCTPIKDATAQYTYYFQYWLASDNTTQYVVDAELPAITGTASYTAVWTSLVNKYSVVWKNGNETLETDTKQPYGESVSYNGATPTREADNNFAYTFDGWSLSDGGEKLNSLPTVNGAMTFYAHYSTTPRYAITFANYDGTQLQKEPVTTGEHPVYNGLTPARARDLDGYFRFIGWKNSVGTDYAANATLPAVTGKETYTAQYDYVNELYTITLNNVDGNGATWSGKFGVGSMPFYDPNNNDTPVEPAKEGDAQYKNEFTGWEPALMAVTGPATYTAQFEQKIRKYNITFANLNGNGATKVIEVEYGQMPVYSGSKPTYTVGQSVYVFRAWKAEGETIEYAYTESLPVVHGAKTYVAQYDRIVNMEISSEENIENNTEVTSTTIRATGRLQIASTVTLNTTDLVLESTTNASGELIGASQLNVMGDAYFDVKFNGEAGTANRTWYAITVPWEVDAANGIFCKGEGSQPDRHLSLGGSFELVWYDGAERAANGDGFDCWRFVANETDKMMHPGKMYMMYFYGQNKTVRFKKKDGAPIRFEAPGSGAMTTVSTYAEMTDNDGKDASWNGIGNPSVYHAYLSAGATYCQVLNNGSVDDYLVNHPEGNPVYQTVSLSSYMFVVGKPVFVQATGNQSVMVIPESGNVFAAPRRARAASLPEGMEAVFEVHVGTEGHMNADNLFVQATGDEKEDRYVIGQDLSKGGVAKTIPQLWVNRYNSKLSVNTQTLTDESAEYPLSIYVPNEGTYVLHTSSANDEYDLYLTQDGKAIWNLSQSPYIFDSEQGTHTAYGLRISSKAPETLTGIDEIIVNTQDETAKKVLVDDIIYIIRGENVYTTTGKKVQ